MNKNPFRHNPTENDQRNVEEWGKVKFKPTKFKDVNENSFEKHVGATINKPFNKKFDNRKSNFYKKKGICKFNQTARNAKPENATPWSRFKDEIVNKQCEVEQMTLQVNMDTDEAKEAVKRRGMNYRKLLIEQKKQEPISWENFNENNEDGKQIRNKFCGNINFTPRSDHVRQTKKQENKIGNGARNLGREFNLKCKAKLKKTVGNSNHKTGTNDIISKELLRNFDSKKLSFEQNNRLRALITKTASMVHGNTIKGMVENSEFQKRKLKNKQTI